MDRSHQLPVLLPQQPLCQSCNLHTQARNVGIPSRFLEGSLSPSPETPSLVILGRNPGYNEDQEGRCFVGRSGQLLAEGYLAPLGIPSLSSIVLTNAVRCYTTDNSPPHFKNNIRPCFLPHFMPDLLSLWSNLSPGTPRILLCLGDQAAEAVTRLVLLQKKLPLKELFHRNGATLSLPAPHSIPFTLIVTYHPAAVLRDNAYAEDVDVHMTLVHRILTKKPIAPAEPDLVPPFPPPTPTPPSGVVW